MPPAGIHHKALSNLKKKHSALGSSSDRKSITKDEITPPSFSRKRPSRSSIMRLMAREKAWRKKMDALSMGLTLVPFSPGNSLDLTAHESLLRNLELWDFAHLDFGTYIHEDLVKQMMAHYSKTTRTSIVQGFQIQVNCAGLSRAMKLPRYKKSNPAKVIEITQYEVSFLEKFVSKWFLLHGEMWIMPEEILHWMNLLKEGSICQIDWAKVLWFMMEKELHSVFDLQPCFYASHFQHLIKYEKPDLIGEKPDKSTTVDEAQDEELVVEESQPAIQAAISSSSDEFVDEEAVTKEQQPDKVELENSSIAETINNIAIEDTAMDIEIEAEILPEGDVENSVKPIDDTEANAEVMDCKNEMLNTSIMGRCKQTEACQMEEERKYHEAIEMEDLEVEEGEEDDEVDEEENEEGDVGLSILSQRHNFEAVCTGFPSGLHIPEGNFFISGVDSHRFPHQQRNDASWEEKAPSEMDIWIDQMNQIMQKCKEMYSSKEQACHEMTMNQQLYLSELQQRDKMIQRQKEELQKKHMESYRLENELYMMSNLVEGYRKALKRVQSSFAEYREKSSLAKEPVYVDTGCGGLVLSKVEIEKQRIKKEEEDMQTLVVLEAQIKLFEAECVSGFNHYDEQVEMLRKKLDFVEEEWCLLKECFGRHRVRPSNEQK